MDALIECDLVEESVELVRASRYPTILHVSDRSAPQSAVAVALATEDYHLQACRPTDTERVAREVKPDIFLIDLGPVGASGIGLIQALRKWTRKRIIVLTDDADEAEKVAALDAGADDCLTRIVGIEELKARLRVASRRVTGPRLRPPLALFRFGDILVNLSTRRVTRGGKEIRLTPIEFRLLAVLCAQPGKVISHETLLEAVWGPSSVGKTHYLHIYIKHLRSKFGGEGIGKDEYIETIACFGYRLLATKVRPVDS